MEILSFSGPLQHFKALTLRATKPLHHLLSSGASHLFFPSLVKEHRPGRPLPPQGLAGVWGAATLTIFSAIVYFTFFSFDFPSHFLWPANIFHPPPLCMVLSANARCGKMVLIWNSVSGVSTIVEIVDRNRWVIVLVSEKSREAAEICSSVIRMILDLQQQLCSVVSTCECLISPSLLDRAIPVDALPDTDLFVMRDVARSMLLHHKVLLDRKEGMNTLLNRRGSIM